MHGRTRCFTVSILLVSCGLLSGCLKLQQTLTINADASGLYSLSYSISEDAIVQARAVSKLSGLAVMQGSGQTEDRFTRMFLNPDEATLRREFKTYERYGVTIDSLKVQTKGGWRQVALRLAFKDIAQLQKADFFRDYGFSLVKNAGGNYVFVREAASRTRKASDLPLPPETIRLLAPILAGLSLDFNVSVPGRIVTTSAHRQTQNTATWSYRFDKDPNAFVAVQRQQFNVLFEGKGLTLPDVRQKQP